MSFGDTLTITPDGTGGTDVVLARINNDAYTTEYFKPGTVSNYRVRIRHSKETVKAGSVPYERHNVEFTEEVFAVGAVPAFTRQVYAVIRHKTGDTEADVTNLGEALSLFLSDTNLIKLFGWQS